MDSLRMEKGYRHMGHELDSETSPLEARLMHTVDLNKVCQCMSVCIGQHYLQPCPVCVHSPTRKRERESVSSFGWLRKTGALEHTKNNLFLYLFVFNFGMSQVVSASELQLFHCQVCQCVEFGAFS